MPINRRHVKEPGGIQFGLGAIGQKARDYVALMKPRVMSLAVFTAFVGMMVAPIPLPVFTVLIAMVAIALGAGAAGALNMWYDAELDALMSRTAGRPVPAGRIGPHEALGLGLILATGSVALLAMVSNGLAAALLAFTIFFYAVIYTMWLKRATPQNIVIGGIAGAIPPMIGWAAATGTVTTESLVLFFIIFLWTPPHFWALALFKTGDYEAAGIPMMPNVAGAQSTRQQIFAYSLLLVPVAILPWVFGPASVLYGVCAIGLGAVFIWRAWQVLNTKAEDTSMRSEKRLFKFSILYLFLIFGALLFDSAVAPAFSLISR